MSTYSPYNKTYRYLVYQNQAYHMKNKKIAAPEVKTNLRHSMSRFSPVKNPQSNLSSYMYRSKSSQSTSRTNKHFNVFLTDNQIKNVIIDNPIKLIHKHQSFEKFNKARIDQSNQDLVDRMIDTSCAVLKKRNALSSYEKHQRYSQIRARYNEAGQRKDSFSLGKKSLLCPTLAQYMKSGLGDSFLLNLSAFRQRRSISRQKSKGKSNEK